jgi:hypothetical protein
MAFLSLAMARKGSARKYQDGPPSRAATAPRGMGIPWSPVGRGMGIIAVWFAPGPREQIAVFCIIVAVLREEWDSVPARWTPRARHPGAACEMAHSRAPQRGQGDQCQGEEIRAAISTVLEAFPLAGSAVHAGGRTSDDAGAAPAAAPPGRRCRWPGGTVQLTLASQAERNTERSGVFLASGNEVFALLDRTETGQCLVAFHRPPGFNGLRKWVRLARL